MSQMHLEDFLPTVITNPFTGEKRMAGERTPETIFAEKRAAGLALRAKEAGQQKYFGEPHPYTGELQSRPKHIGRTYDIPPDDGTYCPDQVDLVGAEAVDINQIMKKWDPSGKQFNKAIAQGMTTDAGMFYDDFTDSKSLQDALEITIHAKQQFEMLPAEIRNRFENEPGRFLDFVNDPKTLEEQYKLGIRIKKKEAPKDATLKDVINTLEKTGKGSKAVRKGGTPNEDEETS